MYIYDKSVDQDFIFYVDVGLVLLNVVGNNIGAYLLNKRRWSPKIMVTLGGFISLGGYLTASFQTSLNNFLIAYSLGSFGNGMMFMVPLVCAWDYFPERKGLTTGVIEASYGLGPFFYNRFATYLINPDDANAPIEINKDVHYFTKEVAERVPFCY